MLLFGLTLQLDVCVLLAAGSVTGDRDIPVVVFDGPGWNKLNLNRDLSLAGDRAGPATGGDSEVGVRGIVNRYVQILRPTVCDFETLGLIGLALVDTDVVVEGLRGNTELAGRFLGLRGARLRQCRAHERCQQKQQ